MEDKDDQVCEREGGEEKERIRDKGPEVKDQKSPTLASRGRRCLILYA